jgi:hypothetical protein
MQQNKKPQSKPDERIYAATEVPFGYITVMVITALLLVVLLGMMLLATPWVAVASLVMLVLVVYLAFMS